MITKYPTDAWMDARTCTVHKLTKPLFGFLIQVINSSQALPGWKRDTLFHQSQTFTALCETKQDFFFSFVAIISPIKCTQAVNAADFPFHRVA